MIIDCKRFIKLSHQNLIPFFILLSILNRIDFAQTNSTSSNFLLLATLNQIEGNIRQLDSKIAVYENEIIKCDKTISNSQKVIKIAREKSNSEAEKIANDALLKSKSAKDKNISLLKSAQRLKIQSEVILSSLKKEMLNNTSSNNINAMTLNYSGNISIQKNNGEKYQLADSKLCLLENDDIITTGFDGKIELQFMEGRGNLSLGENSKLKFNKTDSMDVVSYLEGKVKIKVDKMDEFEKKLKSTYENLKDSHGALQESYEQFLARLRAKVQKRLEVRIRSSGTSGIRGTEFAIKSDSNGSELFVLEGVVEMASKDKSKKIILNAGQKGILNSNGSLSDPINVDLNLIDKWWEENELQIN